VNADVAKECLGATVAEQLFGRLADIEAATSVYDLPLGNPHAVGDDEESYALVIGDTALIIFAANHNQNPRDSDGHIDWNLVSRIRILHIGKHE